MDRIKKGTHYCTTGIDKMSDFAVSENSESKVSTIEILRVGTLYDRNKDITQEMLSLMVENFQSDVVGTRLFVNRDHKGGEACGWIQHLQCTNGVLYATVDWTKLGVQLVRDKLYQYVSIEFSDQIARHTDGKLMKYVVTGLALTNEPALPRQQPLKLSKEYILTNLNMDVLKTFLSSLLGREKLRREDVETYKTMLSAVPEEDREEAEAKVAELEAKVEEESSEGETAPEEAAKEDSDKAEGEEPEANAEELSKARTEKVMLAKIIEEKNELSKRVEALENEKRRTHLSSKARGMVVSNTRDLGFPTAHEDKVTNFMLSLNDRQIDEFTNLMSSLVSYDTRELGKSVIAPDLEGSKQMLSSADVERKIEEINKGATKLSKETGRSFDECVAELTAQVYNK